MHAFGYFLVTFLIALVAVSRIASAELLQPSVWPQVSNQQYLSNSHEVDFFKKCLDMVSWSVAQGVHYRRFGCSL